MRLFRRTGGKSAAFAAAKAQVLRKRGSTRIGLLVVGALLTAWGLVISLARHDVRGVDCLTQLEALHRAGALSDEEFGTAKARILGTINLQ